MIRRALLSALIILITSSLWGQEGFADIFQDDGQITEEAAAVELSGDIGLELTYYVDDEWDSAVDASPMMNLRVDAATDNLAGTAVFNIEIDESVSPKLMTELVDELYLEAFFHFGYLQAGMFKIEWGKGDGTHVIDPLNPLSQSDGFDTDIFNLKRAEVMASMNFYLGEHGLLELVYKPFFHPLDVASAGRWALAAPDVSPPDTKTLETTQGAARITGSLGFLDLGALYYYGFMSEPGYVFDTVFTGSNPFDPTHYTTTVDLLLTKAQLIGIEGVAAVGPLTVRTEMGYWVTEDTDSDRPELYNNRFVYLGGLDMMISTTEIFLSFQVTGAVVQGYTDLEETDVDRQASFDNTAHTTTLIGAVDIPFAQDQIKLRVSGLYLVQGEGYVILPQLIWSIEDDLQLTIHGQVFGGEENDKSPYYSWDDNDNISIGVTYIF